MNLKFNSSQSKRFIVTLSFLLCIFENYSKFLNILCCFFEIKQKNLFLLKPSQALAIK